MTIRGSFSFQRPPRNPTRVLRAAATRGLQRAAEHVLGESNKIVPLEEGTLQRSGTTSVDYPKAAVSYDTPYAARQHEELTWRHDPPRQAKYLERSILGNRDTVGKIVSSTIKSEVGD